MPLAPPPQRSVTSSSCSIFDEGLAEPDDDARNAAVADDHVGAEAERHHRHVGVEIAAGSATRSSRRPARTAIRHCRRVLNQTSGASGASAVSLPRTCGQGRDALISSPSRCADAVGEPRRPFGDVARAHADDMSPSRGEVAQRCGRGRRASSTVSHHAVAVRAQALGQRRRIDALDRLLARRIDRRDEHDVGVVEGVLEVVHQIAAAGCSGAAGRPRSPAPRPLSRAAASTARISTG